LVELDGVLKAIYASIVEQSWLQTINQVQIAFEHSP
jgi:hypothetical protein